ncbi:MAG: hypothetical protein AAF481_06120 [Acidobacteriota bacterium]
MSPSRPGRDLAATLAGGGLYGAVLGSWSGAELALYAAIKLPLALLVTAGFALLFNVLIARVFGERLGFGAVVALNLATFARAAVVLASLAPVAALFTHTLDEPSPEAQATHNLLYLLHVAAVGGAGLAGCLALRSRLRWLCASGKSARNLFVAWVLTLALVGGEVTWALRPFVGSVHQPVAFLRADALDGNVYEFILRDIAPFLLAAPERAEPAGASAADPKERKR